MTAPRLKVRVPDPVAGTIRNLHPEIKRKIRAGMDELAAEVRSGKPLKRELVGLWSLRVGRFRIIYRLKSERRIELVAVGPRATIYEETYRLISRATQSETS
jgi:mRNA interferase RelE/StbE